MYGYAIITHVNASRKFIKGDFMKKHMPKIMLLYAISLSAMVIFTIVYYVGRGYSLDHNQEIRLLLQFISSGLFFGLYQIISLMEKK